MIQGYQSLSDDSSNYDRIIHLLMEEGTKRVRELFFSAIPKGLTLEHFLQLHQQDFQDLRQKNIMSSPQYALLFPRPAGTQPDPMHFDISLLVILIRNVTSGGQNVSWKGRPKSHETLPEHDVMRIRNLRNTLYHNPSRTLSGNQFCKLWEELTDALSRLGTPDDVIQYYADRDLDPETTKACLLQMRQQSIEEQHAVYIQGKKNTRSMKRICLSFGVFFTLVFVALVCVVAFVILPGQHPCKMEPEWINWPDDYNSYLQFMPRAGWGARHSQHVLEPFHHLPLNTTIIYHTASIECTTNELCCSVIQKIQLDHMETFHHWDNIGYNFLIGEDGVVYEGRGWDFIGAHTPTWNKKSIGIAMIGNFCDHKPNNIAMEALINLLKYGVYLGKLDPNFSVLGQCQIRERQESPGKYLYDVIRKWRHWREALPSEFIGNISLSTNCTCTTDPM
ncbi:uncharacterized protein LOC106150586 [Lingula anatina]|uniref:Uncharacterized protein LOC106150586 n=1 Tax=Lingula anatina TaxID=7574 RepID=A0A1S3GYT5_LINAN|nr:uncharacterized protein LOC106150586 [Lingula anatina]|eukprot:XP_013378923.1 uncharacterized protein LOC106150586 [Lingula anatina]